MQSNVLTFPILPKQNRPLNLEWFGPLQDPIRELQQAYGVDPGMVALTLLSSASYSVQHLYKVKQARHPSDVLSLITLIAADSASGKSQILKPLLEPVKATQKTAKKNYEQAKPRHDRRLKAYERALDEAFNHPTWEAQEAAEMDAEKINPGILKGYKRLHSDTTIEGLMKSLDKDCASQYWATAELARVFGWSMTKENRSRTLATLCELCDGDGASSMRMNEESITAAEGKALGILWLGQPAIVDQITQDAGARTQGFIGRAITYYAAQNKADIDAPGLQPENSTALLAFQSRMQTFLETEPNIEDNEIQHGLITVEHDAEEALKEYHKSCRRRTDLGNVQNESERSAQLATKLAAIMCVYDGRNIVNESDAFNATQIAQWLLERARDEAPNLIDRRETQEVELVRQQLIDIAKDAPNTTEPIGRLQKKCKSNRVRKMNAEKFEEIINILTAAQNPVIKSIGVPDGARKTHYSLT